MNIFGLICPQKRLFPPDIFHVPAAFSCLFHQQPSHSAVCPVASAFARNESPPLVPSSPRSGSRRPFWKHDLWRFLSPDLNKVKSFPWEIRHREASHFLCQPSRSFSQFLWKVGNFIWDFWRALGSAWEVRTWTWIRLLWFSEMGYLSLLKLPTCSLPTLLVCH